MRFFIICFAAAALIMLSLPAILSAGTYAESGNAVRNAGAVHDENSGGIAGQNVIIEYNDERHIATAPTEHAGKAFEIKDSTLSVQSVVKVYDNLRDEVMTLELEEYICGVVMAEMPASFGEEALKAQAIAARSYAVHRIMHNTPANHKGGAPLCTDYAHCKAYFSYRDAALRWSEDAAAEIYPVIKAAVDATRGIIMEYEGAPVDAVFHSRSEGSTEAAVNLWGADVPYLTSVDTPESGETCVVSMSAVEFRDILESAGFKGLSAHKAGEWIEGISLNDTGRVDNVAIAGGQVSGRRMRELFGLKSTDFELVYLDGSFVFSVRGYGHGVGMSQYGANELAERGFECFEILAHYYRGVDFCIIC